MDIIRNSIIGLSTILILLVLIWVFDEEEKPHIDSVIGDKEYDIKNYIRNDLIIKNGKESYISIKEDYNKKLTKQKWDNQIKLGKIEYDRKQARLAELEKLRLAREKEKKGISISRSNSTTGYESDWMAFNASYFTSKCYKCSGITKSGYDVRNTIYYNGYRIMAADLNVIPLWSLVEVVTPHETFKAIILDSGGRIKQKKLDILVSSKDEAYRLGRHDVKLRVIKYGGKE